MSSEGFLPTLAHLKEEAVEVLDPGVVKFAGLFMLILGISCGYLLRRWVVTPLSQPNTLTVSLNSFSNFGI